MTKTQDKMNRYKVIISQFLPKIVVLLFIMIVAFLFALSLTQMLFVDRLDETRAVALSCSFQSLPFESRDVTLDVSGEKITLLNVTLQGQEYSLYSTEFTSQEISNIGVLEENGREILVLWPLEADEEKQYVINAKFIDFYKFGTTEQMPVLFVENVRELGLLDEFIFVNRFLLSHIAIGFWALTSTCILAFVGYIFMVVGEMG